MLTNTINVSSWLMLNALAPSTLPESVTQQYKDQFVKWPEITPKVQMRHLFFALQALRNSIKSLLEFQFTHDHVQPLIELCMTIRLQTLGSLASQTGDAIIAIADRENWKTDVVGNESKTSLPDMYESVINEMLPQLKQILSHNGYPSETDLFAIDVYRQVTHNLFSGMITSIKECYDKLLGLTPAHSRPTHLRPNQSLNASSIDDSASISSANDDPQRAAIRIPLEVQQPSSRKFLISVCNMEYIINHSLPLICKRLSDNGVKFADVILEKTKIKLASIRQGFISKYLGIKQAPLISLVEAGNYEKLPEIDDVSFFTKELIMCIVFIQAELYQIAPQLMQQVISHIVEITTDKLLIKLNDKRIYGKNQVTQVVIDLTALEQTLKSYLSPLKKKEFSRKRAELMSRYDKEHFNNAMATFDHTMELAVQSLDTGNQEGFDALESSRV
uniref:Exocyst complex component 2 n=1 Tax=Panagrolaimus davidi TaxID=227884 RepID=A0A914PC30_9BILA